LLTSQIEIGTIPYQSQHTAARAEHTLRSFIEESEQITGTNASFYLFSKTFPVHHPDILADATEVHSYLRSLGGGELRVEQGVHSMPCSLVLLLTKRLTVPHTPGPRGSPIEGRELTTQFFVGGLNSGSPIHYHALAVNVVALGRKEWLVARPEHAFYTNQPAAEMVRDELGDGDDINGSLSFDSVHSLRGQFVHFIQNPLDIVIVPSDWAHGTLNTEFTVGMAVETLHPPTMTRLNGAPEIL